MSILTGKVVSDVPLSNDVNFAGPLAIDPFTSNAYSLIFNLNSTCVSCRALLCSMISL